MSETDDKRELSGLARSIDALFTGPAPGRATLPEDPAGPSAVATEPFEAVTEQPREVLWEPALDAAEGPLDALDLPTRAEEPAFDAPGDEPDPDAFAAAVEAFLAGTPAAAAELEERATVLKERLALDPLADAVERLVREAGDPPDPTLVDMAGEIINPAVASRIVQRIGHEREEDRIAEYTVLCRRLGEIMAKAFRGALTAANDDEAHRKYHDMLIATSDTCRSIIEEMVDDENTLLVRSGVAILGEIGGETAVPLVTSALANPDARVRREALLSLGKLGDEESGALVMGLLEDSEREVRAAAATAAAELHLARALRPILAQLEAEGDGDGAIPFIDALGELGDPGAVPAIEKRAVKTLFSKPPTEVRIAAYRALHRIGTPHARDLVQKALASKEPGIWAAVRQMVQAAGHE